MGDNCDSTGLAEMPGAMDDEPSEPPRRLTLDVLAEDGDWSAFEPVETLLAATADAVALRLDLTDAEAAVALSSDAKVQELNRTYRGKDKPTNVLSFPADLTHLPPGAPRYLGDIALAAETIVREAAEQDKTARDHLQHLVVHGLLHLLGHDHESEGEALEMEALEVEILGQLGINDPYAGAE